LKLILAVALATGDEFFVAYNLSIDTNEIMLSINRLNFIWEQEQKRLRYGIFLDAYVIDFAAMAGASGICYNFNMINAADLYHLEL
jgi:hypothetical protein